MYSFLSPLSGLGMLPPTAITTGPLCGSARNIQTALNDLGYGPLATDGQIGSGTQKAMASFCAAVGIPKKSWPDVQFCAALREALVPPPVPEVSPPTDLPPPTIPPTPDTGQPPQLQPPPNVIAATGPFGMSKTTALLVLGVGGILVLGGVAVLLTAKPSS